MQKEISSKIKFTVIAGYLLVVIVMALGLYGIYRNLVVFSNQRIKNEDITELLIVGNTLSKLYEIENGQNLFTAESARQYFLKYDSVVPEINRNLNKLKQYSQDTGRIVTLDTIKFLIHEKKVNLEAVAVLLDSLNRAPLITSSTESSYVPRALNREVSDFLEKNNLRIPRRSQSDTTVVAGQRKGFLDRVRNVFVASPDSTVVISNKAVVNEHEFKVIVDTLINKIRYSEKLDLARQKALQAIFTQRLDTMNFTNRMLTVRIDDLLKGIEQAEMKKSLQLVIDKEKALAGSQRTMFVVSCLAILIALVFGILFLVDINRSQRYRRQLESSHNRISQLLASREKLMLTISHDIKAPMSSILGYIHLMEGGGSESENEPRLRNMKHSGEHVLQLVSMLLDHHKLEAGTWQLTESNIHLHALVEETADSFRPLAKQKYLSYVVDNKISPEQIFFGDPYVMRQIMGNLISNAVKYTAVGEVLIVAMVKKDEGGDSLLFSVSDTGRGIDPADRQYIFQEFSRLDNSGIESANMEGSGLGLAITKGFVDALQGSISFISEKEKGSEFIVELPLHPAQKEDDKIVGTGFDLEGISVLVVDDDLIQLNMIAEMLQKERMHCVIEANPRKVVSQLSENLFDIVFVDIRMPHIDGITLVEKIRVNKNTKEVPVIALSAESEMSAAELQAAGFTDYLSKPFETEHLYSIIWRYVKSGKTGISYPVHPVKPRIKGAGALIDFVRDDKQASRGILKSFISETIVNMEKLQNSFAEKDEKTAREIAHKLLPLFQMMGNEEVIGLLRQLNDDHQWSGVKETTLLEKLRSSVEEVENFLTEMERAKNDTPNGNR
ncbi:MAG: hybrid sensor histidine kinase/response regulator [Proteiniphilum sp.]|jgi:signal transduction histidine kinase/DNA-binding NarL/FixJ family response regulator|nr:hybrid sensor histidine kinase/response regulator [Proteiniphilum sp.]